MLFIKNTWILSNFSIYTLSQSNNEAIHIHFINEYLLRKLDGKYTDRSSKDKKHDVPQWRSIIKRRGWSAHSLHSIILRLAEKIFYCDFLLQMNVVYSD